MISILDNYEWISQLDVFEKMISSLNHEFTTWKKI